MITLHGGSWGARDIQRDPFVSAYPRATAIPTTPPEPTTRCQAAPFRSTCVSLIHLFTPPATPDIEGARGSDPRKPCSNVTEISSPATTLHSLPTPPATSATCLIVGDHYSTSLYAHHLPDEDPLASFERDDAFISTLTIDEKIGEGSYGLIYCGSVTGGKFFAIKLMKKTGDAEQDSVFQEEIDAMERAVESDWAVKLKYWRYSETHVLIAMSLFSGGNLYDYAKTQRSFEPDLAIFWAAEILLGLHSLHTLGIIHRDIKPENVMLDVSGHIKIIDFGLAKLFDHNSVSREDYPLFHSLKKTGGDLFPQIWALDSNPHTTAEPFGTQGFAPPELWQRRHYSFGVDYFAMSCVLYELLTGKLPFAYDSATDNYDVMNIAVDLDETLPDVQRDFLRKTLIPNPVLRPSVSHMKRHLLFKNINWHALARCELDPPISF
ncbi:kinase-like protein [Macrolepiota fuliginosa MF-IS2]|uniref:Kinase-like protein n=1 Tax=Macrolepiota fuliginosa MF-IS2 TaxID=1400762 RepID=A0A9P5X2Y0_9AGAR|nr:kinase-like protein [Macrolepiota fuliginosa MF-IS2]